MFCFLNESSVFSTFSYPSIDLASGGSLFVSLHIASLSYAGSITAESDWNKNNAIERARQQIPADATITG